MTVGVIKCRHKKFPLTGDYLLILKFRFLTAHIGYLGPLCNNIHVVPDDEILIQNLYSVKNHGIILSHVISALSQYIIRQMIVKSYGYIIL